MELKPEMQTPKIVADILAVTPDLLKVWTNEFNIQTERSQGGHRRYSKENIEELMAIKEKIQVQKWSYNQVRSWRNGELHSFVPKEEKLELEKKLDEILENQKLQNQFNKALVQKLQEITNELVTTKEHLANTEKKLTEVESKNGELEVFIEKKLEKRDQLLLENIRVMQRQNQKPKRKSFFDFFKSKMWLLFF
ncbi:MULTISPECIES: MerR family transcriptional regulator [Bacillus]|uniref:MerR family transcriptional regulator n=1 Tax=Bacillus TaxID=1386 RepID=UPI00077ACB8B|nr:MULTISPECIES: MerR family transcriptional regulator [Bacillus cereus group]KXY69586.1 mercury resistance protein [Bacillus cereus]MBG9939228.1 mercury resistance protein [Bacillus tropicus]MED2996228.1 MerR family transcriptional regulator [Bacillus tropicus]OTY50211.1 mercury resistance protein [Bacillus thuringiensis serovar graciosensis]